MNKKFNNILNIRDLGGYKTKDGHFTKKSIFIRSNLIEKLEGDDISYLINNNILTIIDLREKEEIESKPSYFQNDKRFNYYNVVLKGRNAPLNEEEIPLTYMNIIDDKDSMKKLFQIILKSNYGVLFNCNLGKDRTGVVSMLLLKLANVDDLTIINDYSISDKNLEKVITEIYKKNPDLPKFLGRAKSWYMAKTLEIFNKKYLNIENYLNYLEFTKKDIEIIRNKFK